MGQAKSKKNQEKAQPKKPLWPWLTAAGVCVAVLAGVLIWALTSGGGSAETGKHHVAITVRDYGTITVELDADAAPITVQNFLDLADSGFYDGLTFHRIIEGFMIQGGDPEGTGMGGSDKTIKGEFSANGVENPLSHTRGAISMARSSAMDSASSQFFIVQKDSTFLDGTIPADQQPVIESVKVLD